MPFAIFGIFSFLGNYIIGMILWTIYGYWYLDSLIALEVSYWFKGFSLAFVLSANGANNGISEDPSRPLASGFFSLGFLIALAKYIFID